MTHRVLICGGRDFDDRELVARALNNYFYKMRPSDVTVIVGRARGADTLAEDYARLRYMSVAPYPADWRKNGRRAGPIRNQKMLDEGKPDAVIAFPGGKGTADMVSRAKAAGIPVICVPPDLP